MEQSEVHRRIAYWLFELPLSNPDQRLMREVPCGYGVTVPVGVLRDSLNVFIDLLTLTDKNLGYPWIFGEIVVTLHAKET